MTEKPIELDEDEKQELINQLKKIEEKRKAKELRKVFGGATIQYGLRGKDFEIKSNDGSRTIKCHQSVSGALYIYEKNGKTIRRVTEKLLNEMEKELNTATPTNKDDSKPTLEPSKEIPQYVAVVEEIAQE